MAIAVTQIGGSIGVDVTSVTGSATCSGSNRVIHAWIALRNPVLGATSVTFNGVGLTKVESQLAGVCGMELWELIAPAATTANLVATFPGTLKAIMHWMAMSGVHQTTPRGTAAKANSVSSDTSLAVVVSSAVNELVHAGIAWKWNGAINPQGTMIERSDQQTGTDSTHLIGAMGEELGAASVSMGWDFSGGQIGSILAVPIKPVTTSTLPADVGITNQALQIVTPDQQAGYGGVWSFAPKDATASYFFSQLVTAGTQGATRESSLEIRVDDGNEGDFNNKVAIRVANSNLEARKVVAGTPTTLATTAYVSGTHRFLRIREAGGTTFWEHSTDAITWNTLHSVANPITMSNVRLSLMAGHTSAVAATTVVWDNTNATGQSPPAGSPVSDEGTLLGVS